MLLRYSRRLNWLNLNIKQRLLPRFLSIEPRFYPLSKWPFFLVLYLFGFGANAQMNQKPGNIHNVLDLYFELSASLSKSDLKTSLIKTSKLVEEVNEKAYPSFFPMGLQELKKATSLAEIRSGFYSFSQELRKILPFAESLEDEIYVYFCKEAISEASRFWLSDTRKTINPYSENKEFNCADRLETIKPIVK